MQTTIESNDNPIFIDPVTGFRMRILCKDMNWGQEELIYQPKWTYIPEHIVYEGTVNEQVVPATHKQTSLVSHGRILTQYRVFYHEDGTTDMEGNPIAGYGALVQSSAINQGRVVEFKVTNAVWVNATTGIVVPFNSIALTDAEGNLIEDPHAGLIGEYDRFIQLKDSGASVDELIIGGCIQALQNGRFA
jgi:hypothetical protein